MSNERNNYTENVSQSNEEDLVKNIAEPQERAQLLPDLSEPQAIKHSTEFDPSGQLRIVKNLQGEARRQAMDQYVTRYVEQKEDLAKFQTDVLDYIRSMPDLSLNELLEYSVQQSKELGFSPQQLTVIEWVLAEYQSRHVQVENFRQTFPDDAQLFKAIFSRPPLGKVEVIKRPMNLYFRCYDVNDYAYIHSQKWQTGEEVGKDDLARASLSGGASLAVMNGMILIENCNDGVNDLLSEQVLVHEEQHAFARLFNGVNYKMDVFSGKYRAWSNMGSEKASDRELAVKRYFRFVRFDLIDRWSQDELLAYLISDYPDKNLANILLTPKELGGLYDYENTNIDYFMEVIENIVNRVGEDNREMVIHNYNTVMKEEYKNLLLQATQAMQDLETMGYSRSEIVGILLHEPLHAWSKVVSRIGGELAKSMQPR